MDDLKSCPFCGGIAQFCATDDGGKYATPDLRKGVMIRGLLMTHRIIRCMKCGARTKVYATDRGAFNAWNRRTNNV